MLVNNAGVAHVNKPMLDIDEKEFDHVFAVNVKGLFMFTQAVVPLCAERRRHHQYRLDRGPAAASRPLGLQRHQGRRA